jgi:sulfatase modifying factor 1
MIRIILTFFILFCIPGVSLPGQDHSCPDAIYNNYIEQGNKLKKTDFKKALANYNAARDWCPGLSKDVDDLIVKMFVEIEEQRAEAKRQEKIASQKAQEALQAKREAEQKERELQMALDNLAEVSQALVKEFIQKADTTIYHLDYHAALVNTEKASLFDYSKSFEPKITKLWMELIFWFHESHQYAQAEKIAFQALEYLQLSKPLEVSLTKYKTHFQAQSALFTLLTVIDPDQWLDSLIARYYPDLVSIEGGIFSMGCDTIEGDRDCIFEEYPPHSIEVSDFSMARTETTLWQFYLYCVASGNLKIENFSKAKDLDWGLKGRLPAIYVTWWEAASYSNWLNKQFGRDTVYVFYGSYDLNKKKWPDSVLVRLFEGGGQFRLPTEAEWEFAARGGTKAKKRYRFAGSDDLDRVGWDFDIRNQHIHPVASKSPNDLGLYDLSGNIWEWCQDWYGKNYYTECKKKETVVDPLGPKEGEARILRGGSWIDLSWVCRVTNRKWSSPKANWDYYGFRLCQD